MNTKHLTAGTPEVLQIKISAEQHRNFAACARMCGLGLEAWIVQCADVRAADVIDAVQIAQRGQRPDRKPQRPRPPRAHASKKETEESLTTEDASAAKNSASKTPSIKRSTSQTATLRAARSYNERFRRRGDTASNS